MRLPDGVDDRALARAALERDIVVRALSGYYAQATRAASGLLLGYACVPEDEIGCAFDALSRAIDDVAFGRAAAASAAPASTSAAAASSASSASAASTTSAAARMPAAVAR